MLSGLDALLDPEAFAIVLAGTLLATLARSGWNDLRVAGAVLVNLCWPSFDEAAHRAALARTVREIAKRGHLCAETPALPDDATERWVGAYITTGSLEASHGVALAERAARETRTANSVRVLQYAGELAPVFGFVGTLFAITQIAPVAGLSPAETTMDAVAMAVLSTLYGVLTAHLVCLPLARAIERGSEREELAREALIAWFEEELVRGSNRQSAKLKDAA